MTRDDKSNKKRSKENEENRYFLKSRHSPASTDKTWGAQATRSTRSREDLPPPPPLPSNVTPLRYHLATPSPSPPPRGSSSDCSDPSATAVLALPKPSAAAEAELKKSASETGKLSPSSAMDSGSHDAPQGCQDKALENHGLAITEVTPSGDTSVPSLPSPDQGKKRSASPTQDQQPQSPSPSDSSSDGVENKFLSPQAKKIKVMLEDYVQTLVKEGPKFPTILPPTLTSPEKCNLNLPQDSFTARIRAACVQIGLEEVQGFLLKKPLNKARVLEAIEAAISEWNKQYEGMFPAEIEKLISLLNSLAIRLEGKTPPNLFENETITLAEEQVRPLLEQIDNAVSLIGKETQLFEGEMPGLRKELDKLRALDKEHEEEAAKFDRMAEDARKKAKEIRSQQRHVGTKLKCIKVTSNAFQAQTGQLIQRSEEAKAFLALIDEQKKQAGTMEPPEVALILAYTCGSLEKGT